MDQPEFEKPQENRQEKPQENGQIKPSLKIETQNDKSLKNHQKQQEQKITNLQSKLAKHEKKIEEQEQTLKDITQLLIRTQQDKAELLIQKDQDSAKMKSFQAQIDEAQNDYSKLKKTFLQQQTKLIAKEKEALGFSKQVENLKLASIDIQNTLNQAQQDLVKKIEEIGQFKIQEKTRQMKTEKQLKSILGENK